MSDDDRVGGGRAFTVDGRPPGFLRRLFGRGNRRRVVQKPPVRERISIGWARVGRRLLGGVKIAVALGCLAGVLWGAKQALRHVVASPRFALREVRLSPVKHMTTDDVLAMAGVRLGDRLLKVDTNAVAARISAHPWVASVRVRRELPSALVIDIEERHAAAVAVMGGLYLVDDSGLPFKRANLAEADGHVLLTGIDREQLRDQPIATEAAFREALDIIVELRRANRPRPPVSEIHIDPAAGFSLFLRDGGGEVRLGRGRYTEKLARLDEIVRAAGPDGAVALELVHLELDGDRVPVRMAPPRERPQDKVEKVAARAARPETRGRQVASAD